MRHITLQTLTWGTVAAAVSSALWLAASEPGGGPEARRLAKSNGPSLRLVPESTGADTRDVASPANQRGQSAHGLSR